jgi:hypothetical protein
MTINLGTLGCGESPYDAEARKMFDGVPMDLRMQAIETDLHEIKETLELIKATMLRADTTIASIAGEVKPTLDALTKNPAVRMFLGVKKGDTL